MKKEISLILTVVFTAVFFANSCKSKRNQANMTQETIISCIDPSKINPNGICTMDWQPVCGCDNKTYGNACAAINSGVTKFTEGECE